MSRLIDADMVDSVILSDTDNDNIQASAVREYCVRQHAFLDKFPTIDAEPVRHGHWIDKCGGTYSRWSAYCSMCSKKCGCGGTLESQHKRYCPNCGAKMDEVTLSQNEYVCGINGAPCNECKPNCDEKKTGEVNE